MGLIQDLELLCSSKQNNKMVWYRIPRENVLCGNYRNLKGKDNGSDKLNVPYFLCVFCRDKTIADKLIYIPNDYTQNYPFCIFQLVVETFGLST